jgi:hypothetical protein
LRLFFYIAAGLTISGLLSGEPAVRARSAVEGARLNTADILARASGKAKSKLGAKGMTVFPGDNVVPQFVEGSYWSTGITLVNMDTRTLTATVYFIADDGSDLSVPIVGLGNSVRAIDITLPVMNTITIQTPGTTASLKQGYAYIERDAADAGLGGFAVFRQSIPGKPDSEAVVPIVNEFDDRFVLLFDNTNGFSTGVAIANSDSQTEAIPITIRDEDGQVLTTKTIMMNGYAHIAGSLPAMWPETAGKKGSIEFRVNGWGAGVLGLRFHPSGAFTSFHVISNAMWILN